MHLPRLSFDAAHRVDVRAVCAPIRDEHRRCGCPSRLWSFRAHDTVLATDVGILNDHITSFRPAQQVLLLGIRQLDRLGAPYEFGSLFKNVSWEWQNIT